MHGRGSITFMATVDRLAQGSTAGVTYESLLHQDEDLLICDRLGQHHLSPFLDSSTVVTGGMRSNPLTQTSVDLARVMAT